MSFRRQRRPGGDLGRTIRAIRERLDLNQGEFADLLKWHRSMINRCEMGNSGPSVGRLIQLLHLQLTEEQRRVLLAALEGKGISASDFSITASDAFLTAPVSGGATQEAIHEPTASSETPEDSAS